jgi:hypothetical protein
MTPGAIAAVLTGLTRSSPPWLRAPPAATVASRRIRRPCEGACASSNARSLPWSNTPSGSNSNLATSPKGRLGRPVEFGYIIDNEPLARGAVLGLTLETTRDQLTRALLEAAGNELAKITAALGERGLPAGEILGVGTGAGASRSVEIRAAAAGTPITSVPGPASARGAAFQAGVGIGAFTSLHDVPVPPRSPAIVPDPVHEPRYSAQRRRYRELAPALTPFSRGLASSPTNPTRRTNTK